MGLASLWEQHQRVQLDGPLGSGSQRQRHRRFFEMGVLAWVGHLSVPQRANLVAPHTHELAEGPEYCGAAIKGAIGWLVPRTAALRARRSFWQRPRGRRRAQSADPVPGALAGLCSLALLLAFSSCAWCRLSLLGVPAF